LMMNSTSFEQFDKHSSRDSKFYEVISCKVSS